MWRQRLGAAEKCGEEAAPLGPCCLQGGATLGTQQAERRVCHVLPTTGVLGAALDPRAIMSDQLQDCRGRPYRDPTRFPWSLLHSHGPRCVQHFADLELQDRRG